MSPSALRRGLVASLVAPLALAGLTVLAPAASATTPLEARLQLAVLRELNANRRAHHLPALALNTHLVATARSHSAAMATQATMSHQLVHEASLAARVSSTGYDWVALGENIGWTTDTTAGGAVHVERLMYLEKAPNDGHRRNILSTTYSQIGIGVVYDAHQHRIWITEDFGRAA